MRRHIQMDYLFINKGMRYVGYKRERENHVIFIHSGEGRKRTSLYRKIYVLFFLPHVTCLLVLSSARMLGAPQAFWRQYYTVFFLFESRKNKLYTMVLEFSLNGNGERERQKICVAYTYVYRQGRGKPLRLMRNCRQVRVNDVIGIFFFKNVPRPSG